MSSIAYSEITGMASGRVDGAVVDVTSREKDIFDGALWYVKQALN